MSKININQIKLGVFNALQKLQEQAPGMAPVAPPVANTNPVQPLPGQAQNQVVGSSSGEPISSSGEPLTVDTLIDRFNAIRGGKSFSDPEVYGQVTTMYKNLPDQEKVAMDSFLTALGSVVITPEAQRPSVASGQTQNPPQAQPQQKQSAAAVQQQTSMAPVAAANPTVV